MCVFLFVGPSRYDARHRKARRFVYALNLGLTGISPPDKNPPGPGYPTSGDIFYCSGSRQLNHSSYYYVATCNRPGLDGTPSLAAS